MTWHEKYKCEACGHYETPLTVICKDWDKCEECGGQLVDNPEWIPEAPTVIVKGGSTFAPAKHPKQVQNEKGKALRRRKVEILKGPGTVVEKDQLVNKLNLEARADDYKSGALEFDVPRGMQEGFKPEMPSAPIPVSMPAPVPAPAEASKSA